MSISSKSTNYFFLVIYLLTYTTVLSQAFVFESPSAAGSDFFHRTQSIDVLNGNLYSNSYHNYSVLEYSVAKNINSNLEYLPDFDKDFPTQVIEVVNENHIYAVKECCSPSSSRRVKKWNGSDWENLPVSIPNYPTIREIYELKYFSDNEIYVYCNTGEFSDRTIFKFDGANWIDIGNPENDANTSSRVQFESSNEIYLFGLRGAVYIYDGSNWSLIHNGTNWNFDSFQTIYNDKIYGYGSIEGSTDPNRVMGLLQYNISTNQYQLLGDFEGTFGFFHSIELVKLLQENEIYLEVKDSQNDDTKIMLWDGTEFKVLFSSGINYDIQFLFAENNDVYFYGDKDDLGQFSPSSRGYYKLNRDIPSYYSPINFSLTGIQLELQLRDLITDTHDTDLDYTSSTELDVWDVLMITDIVPTNNEDVFLVYGYDDTNTATNDDRTRDKDDNCTSSSCNGLWVREHVYPRSIADPVLVTDVPGAGTDAHSLRASDSQFNNTRSNRLFEDGNGNARITTSGEWYPGDEWKGDVARMMMYMHLRYPSQTPANNVANSSNNTHADMPDIFLEWNAEDPVSEYETQRNEYLETVQGNRNPFIDNPFLATQIWGGIDAEDTWFSTLSVQDIQDIKPDFLVYPNPTSDFIYFEYRKPPNAIYVIDINGREVYYDKDITDNKVELPIERGIYIIVFEFENSVIKKKIIKQ